MQDSIAAVEKAHADLRARLEAAEAAPGDHDMGDAPEEGAQPQAAGAGAREAMRTAAGHQRAFDALRH